MLLRLLAWASHEVGQGRYVDFRSRMLADNLPALEGLLVGVVGFGTIGTAVAQAFQRMGCRIAFSDPTPRDLEQARALVAQSMPLLELLAAAYVVTLLV